MAMICGCSWRISSATARGSIHFSASRPLLERPDVDAVDDARGLVLAERIDQHLAQEFIDADADARSGSPTSVGEVRRAPRRLRRARCSAAASSRRRRAALRARPCASAPARLPARRATAAGSRRARCRCGFVRHSRSASVTLRRRPSVFTTCATRFGSWPTSVRACASCCSYASGCACVPPAARGAGRAAAIGRVLPPAARRRPRELRLEQAAHQRTQHREHEHQQHDQAGERASRCRAPAAVPTAASVSSSPSGSASLFAERRVDDVDAVAALLVEADGVLHELRDVLELLAA